MSRRQLVDNPSWVTHAIASSYDLIQAKVPPEWLPKLDRVRSTRTRLSGRPTELGCGRYGCVLPTVSPDMVLKVTTDKTEAMFAAKISPEIEPGICVAYSMVIELAEKRRGHTVYLLWRDSATDVGELGRVLGKRAEAAVGRQWDAAQVVLDAWNTPAQRSRAIDAWCDAVTAMGRIPELGRLARGMLDTWDHERVFFGDVHAGNLGRVPWQGTATWVITDPGHVVTPDMKLKQTGSRTKKQNPPLQSGERTNLLRQLLEDPDPNNRDVALDVAMQGDFFREVLIASFDRERPVRDHDVVEHGAIRVPGGRRDAVVSWEVNVKLDDLGFDEVARIYTARVAITMDDALPHMPDAWGHRPYVLVARGHEVSRREGRNFPASRILTFQVDEIIDDVDEAQDRAIGAFWEVLWAMKGHLGNGWIPVFAALRAMPPLELSKYEQAERFGRSSLAPNPR